MLRFEVSEVGQEALPAVDIGDDAVVIGSAASARIRLPGHAAREAHVRITGTRWTALADVRVIGADTTTVGVVRGAAGDAGKIGVASDAANGDATAVGFRGASEAGVMHRADETGEVGAGVTFQLGEYRVRVTSAPVGSLAAPPQRTESLARELVRGLLGAGAAPTIEIERGPVPGIKRVLPPPDATIVIGRGEEATWIVLDEDLSRAHAEIHRGWDGVTIRDLASKNGTTINGQRITALTPLRDGAMIELGKVMLRFRDPAERHLQGEATAAAIPRAVHAPIREQAARPPPSISPSAAWPFMIASLIAALAIAGLVWILTT